MLVRRILLSGVAKTVNKMMNLKAFLNQITALERPRMLLQFAERPLVKVDTFSRTSEKKIHNFTLFWKIAAVQNVDFQTFLDFEKKTKARRDLLITFSKITHSRVCLGKIRRSWKFWNWREIFDIYRNWLLRALSWTKKKKEEEWHTQKK